MANPARLLLLLTTLLTATALPAPTRAQATSYDPRAYNVRIGLFPIAFQGGLVQSHFGSALRAEIDLLPRVTLGGFGRLGWAQIGRLKGETAYTAGGLVHIHLSELLSEERLSGTVYPEDAPAIGGGAPAGDDLMDLSPAQKLGGPRLTLPEVDRSLSAQMRTTHSLRASYTFTRFGLQRLRRDDMVEAGEDDVVFAMNRQHALGLGYAWSTHWNLHTGGEGGREVGFRRLYGDLLLAPEGLTDSERFYDTVTPDRSGIRTFGLRVGLEGTSAGMWSLLPGAGLAYSLELGGWFGEGHMDGYLFVALGGSLDLATGGDGMAY